jgi:phosphatidylserine/phosphatidylglycerophosphate/cardiolipin synthase-like enzyme
MANRRRRQSNNSFSRLAGTILGGLLLVAAAFIAQLTGIDIIGMLGGGGTPAVTSVAPTGGGAGTQVAVGNVTTVQVGQGFGYTRGFWEVYFNAPTGSRDSSTYRNGIDANIAAHIDDVQNTLDIAAFEFNNPALTTAVVNALRRGVRVRMVVDDEHTIEDEDSTIQQVISAGAEVVDDARSALMHNKFMILDSTLVVTGSWNFSVNDTYRNNNSALVLTSPQAVQIYQTEFNEMFEGRQFGPRSPSQQASQTFTQDGIRIEVYFASEDRPLPAIIQTINGAQRSVRFMAFSFTDFDMADAMINRSEAGVQVQGIFERTGSTTEFSELRTLDCAGVPVRQDGSSFFLHHKVVIVDESIVIVGSFNFSSNATTSNDENMLIIYDPTIAALYVQEFDRMWAQAADPTGITCS